MNLYLVLGNKFRYQLCRTLCGGSSGDRGGNPFFGVCSGSAGRRERSELTN